MIWWLSFCDADRPAGQQFLGACMVEAPDLVAACKEAWRLGINPGGEVVGKDAPADVAARIPARWLGRLLAKQDIEEFDQAMKETVS